MKNKNALITTIALIISTLATPVHAQVCAANLASLESQEELASLVDGFGGIDGIRGRWKLGGLEGAIVKMKISFRVTNSQEFQVQANMDEFKQVHLCTGNSPGVLHILVVNPKKPENGIFWVRPGKSGNLQIAANGSKWKFMKFKRQE